MPLLIWFKINRSTKAQANQTTCILTSRSINKHKCSFSIINSNQLNHHRLNSYLFNISINWIIINSFNINLMLNHLTRARSKILRWILLKKLLTKYLLSQNKFLLKRVTITRVINKKYQIKDKWLKWNSHKIIYITNYSLINTKRLFQTHKFFQCTLISISWKEIKYLFTIKNGQKLMKKSINKMKLLQKVSLIKSFQFHLM